MGKLRPEFQQEAHGQCWVQASTLVQSCRNGPSVRRARLCRGSLEVLVHRSTFVANCQVTRRTAMPPSTRRDQIMQALNNAQLGRDHPKSMRNSHRMIAISFLLMFTRYFVCVVLEVILGCSSSILARPFCRPESKGSRLEMFGWGCRGPKTLFLLSFLVFGIPSRMVG